MTYTITPANPGDFLRVAALDRRVWPHTPDTFIPDGEHVWRIWCDFATLLVARLDDETTTLQDTGDIAGALVMFPTKQRELCLHKIMVHPYCRGMRIGSALMERALEIADAPVLLTVDPNNTSAVALYRKFGFEVRDRIDGYYRPHEDRFIMVRDEG
jgi:[ribosomal protein S18]-alanine N-acetyltransferase